MASCVTKKESVPGVSSLRSMPAKEFYQADLDVPVVEGTPLLNTMMSDKVNGWFEDFVTQAELHKHEAEEFGQPFTMESQWQVALNTEDCVSVLLKAYQFTGGANGEERMASFTWDKLTNQLVTLEELLPLVLAQPDLDSLAQLCRKELTVALGAQNDPDFQAMIQEGTEPNPDNYQVFTISDKGLSIYFRKYQVAPGYAGTQAVLIPYLSGR